MSWMIIYLILPLPADFSDPPEGTTGSRIAFFSVLLRMGFTCAPPVTGRAVVSYTAFPPLQISLRYISVALALESPPPDVIRHSALWSPDFPHLLPFGVAAAIICLTYMEHTISQFIVKNKSTCDKKIKII